MYQNNMKPTKKQMITALEDRYNIIRWEGDYLLYDRNREARYSNNGAFVAKIQLNNGKYVFNNQVYTEAEKLIEAIDTYVETLPFNSEFYDPIYRKHVKIQLCCREYLEKLGYTHSNELIINGDIYDYIDPLTSKPLFSIEICMDEDSTSGRVVKHISTARWSEIEFSDLDSAIAAINSMLAPYLMVTASIALKTLALMNNSRTENDITDKEVNISAFRVNTSNMRGKLIEALEKELCELKKMEELKDA